MQPCNKPSNSAPHVHAMLRNVVAAVALAQALAWTPAAHNARRTPLLAAEETDAVNRRGRGQVS